MSIPFGEDIFTDNSDMDKTLTDLSGIDFERLGWLVVSALISLLLYIFLMLIPFYFWLIISHQHPAGGECYNRTNYKSGKEEPISIFDKFYPWVNDEEYSTKDKIALTVDELPYNVDKLEDKREACEFKKEDSSPGNEDDWNKCYTSDSVQSNPQSKDNGSGNFTVFDKLKLIINKLPYNFITDKAVEEFDGVDSKFTMLIFFAAFLVFIPFLIISNASFTKGHTTIKKNWGSVGLFSSLVCVFYFIVYKCILPAINALFYDDYKGHKSTSLRVQYGKYNEDGQVIKVSAYNYDCRDDKTPTTPTPGMAHKHLKCDNKNIANHDNTPKNTFRKIDEMIIMLLLTGLLVNLFVTIFLGVTDIKIEHFNVVGVLLSLLFIIMGIVYSNKSKVTKDNNGEEYGKNDAKYSINVLHNLKKLLYYIFLYFPIYILQGSLLSGREAIHHCFKIMKNSGFFKEYIIYIIFLVLLGPATISIIFCVLLFIRLFFSLWGGIHRSVMLAVSMWRYNITGVSIYERNVEGSKKMRTDAKKVMANRRRRIIGTLIGNEYTENPEKRETHIKFLKEQEKKKVEREINQKGGTISSHNISSQKSKFFNKNDPEMNKNVSNDESNIHDKFEVGAMILSMLMHFICGILFLLIFFIGCGISLFCVFINAIFFSFSYVLGPFLYPKGIKNVIKCNMPYIIIILGLSILVTLWQDNIKKATPIVGYQTLIGMTIGFSIMVIITILKKNK